MHAIKDMVREYTYTTGTGAVTLAGAVPGYVSFSAAGLTNGTTVYYEIKNGSNIESGVGTWGTGGILTRTTPAYTLTAGVPDDTSPTALTLVGSSEVMIALSAKMLSDIFAVPSAIGSTTPAAGAFTTLSATGAITYGGVTLSNAVTGTGNMALSISPTFTGIPLAPTAAAATNTTQLATTAFVRTEYAAPPAIGSTTPAAGAFTTLTSNTDVVVSKTITAPATTGAQTINKTAGSVNFAAAAGSLVVTNSLVATSSVIIATVATNDATMLSVLAVAAGGSFTLYANANATAETRVNFIVVN
jgi:hypothetical protein